MLLNSIQNIVPVYSGKTQILLCLYHTFFNYYIPFYWSKLNIRKLLKAKSQTDLIWI